MHRNLALAVVVALAATSGCGKLGVGKPTATGGSTSSAAGDPQPAAPTPKVSITQPVRGAFLAPGRAALVGKVEPLGSDRITTVEVQGQRLPVDQNDEFRGMIDIVEGVNVLQASGTDAHGRTGGTSVGVLAGSFKPLDQNIANAVSVRINEGPIDAMGKIAEAGIWQTDWTTFLKSINPIYDTNFLWMKCWVNIDQVRFRDVAVAIDSKPDYLLTTITVQQPILDVTVVADLGFTRVGPFSAVVEADTATVRANAGLAARSDGALATSMSSPSATFQNFRMTVSSTWVDAAVQLFARNAVESALGSFITDSLKDDLPLLLDRKLAEFLNQQTPWVLLGKPFALDIRAERIAFDEAGFGGALRINANSGATITPRAARAPGSLTTLGAMPQAVQNRGFSITADDDAFNRVLHALWQGGHLDVDIDDAFLQAHQITLPIRLEAGAFRRFLPEIGGVIPDSAPLKLRTEALLPPVIRMAGSPDVAILQAGEVALEILVDRGQGWEKLLRAAVQVELGGNLALGPNGLRVSSLGTPKFRFDLVEEPLLELDDRRLEVLLTVMLTPTIPHMLNSVDVIQIPHLSQLTTFNVDVYADGVGANRDHLTVAGDMTR